MTIRKIVIEYDNDVPILPCDHWRFNTNPKYHEQNIDTLKGVMELVTKQLTFKPIKDNNSIVS
jgi:hypothetical protein